MLGLCYNQPSNQLQLRPDLPVPEPGSGDALIRVLRAGICSTDLEITRGYVPGFDHVLGHEFIGVVEACTSTSNLVGQRVVGEINCNICNYTCADAVFQRNHAPGRTVLGIIGKDGAMATHLTLPVANLHVVPDNLTDQEACFAEPLAAACRIIEQGLPAAGSKVAVIGDGKLGLLVAQVLVAHGGSEITLLGRHTEKMGLVQGLSQAVVVDAQCSTTYAGQFDLCVEASGTADGIRLGLAIMRPLGTLVLKSTVSLNSPNMPNWSELANDIVVNEKTLVGSRCGPFDLALKMMADHADVRSLLNSMVHRTFTLGQGVEALQFAQQKGVLKVQLICHEEQ